MEIISNNDGIVRLTVLEREAISSFNQLNTSIDLVPGFKLAALMYRGKMKSNDLMGVFSALFSEGIQHATEIINEGDIARGRQLALRNFDGDDDAVDELHDSPNMKDLNQTIERVRLTKASDPGLEFVPVDSHSAMRMDDNELLDWHRITVQSALVLHEEIIKRAGNSQSFADRLAAFAKQNGVTAPLPAQGTDAQVERAFAEPKIARKPRRRAKPLARKARK